MIVAYIVTVIIILALLFTGLVSPRKATKAQAMPFFHRNLAHRGLHDNKTPRPENSLAAFRYGVEKGYGAELDVQLSKDGQVVVFHDDTLDRVCGVAGRVDAFTLEELQTFPLCGTEERIPLFTDVLAVFENKAPLIVELKSTPDYRNLCQKTLDILRAYQGEYCVESFDPRIVLWFRDHAPDIMRGQLSESYRGWRKGCPPVRAFLLSRVLTNCVTRPHFVAFGIPEPNFCVRLYRRMGGLLVAWTCRPADDIRKIRRDYDCIIFEGFEPGDSY